MVDSTRLGIMPSPAVWYLLDSYLTLALARYIPANPVDRYTFKKWDTNDWARHNENKYFQVSQSVSPSVGQSNFILMLNNMPSLCMKLIIVTFSQVK